MKWIVLAVIMFLAAVVWAGEKPYLCDDPKTQDVSHICVHKLYEGGIDHIIPYCHAPTYGTMPRVQCYDFEAKEITTFGAFATAKPLNAPASSANDWLCVDEASHKMHRCERPKKDTGHLRGGNWMCLDNSDGKIKKCDEITSGNWSIIELPRRGN